jgi:DNA-directed RNA polymerase specialized sigma24 family protein
MAGMPGGARRPGGGTGIARPDRGDAVTAVTDLFRAHHLELVRLALVMTGDLATAEDVVQDAFERLHRGWPRSPARSGRPEP